MMVNKLKTTTLLCTVMVATALYSTNFVNTAFAAEEKASAPAAPPAMPVDVVVIEQHPIRLWKEFSGRLTAVDFVEIRPQSSGVITKINFEDGQLVNKDDVLYVIDPRPLQAIVNQKKAELMVAKDRYIFASKEYKRTLDLVKKKMVAEQVLDDRINNKQVADSTVKQAKAELAAAEINLNYAYVKAPISGRVSRAELTLGNLVSAGPNAPLLTTIVASEKIYADFEVDEQSYLKFRGKTASNGNNPVELQIQNSDKVYQGNIQAFDNKIDPRSGTIRARAIFNNPDGLLLSGMYARLRLGSESEQESILISERAIATDQNRKYVYVINDENKATYREVVIGDSINGSRIVHSGLKVGDQVIVRGLMRIRPNMLVKPIIASTKSSN